MTDLSVLVWLDVAYIDIAFHPSASLACLGRMQNAKFIRENAKWKLQNRELQW
jgi:hypothetical protein